MKTIKSILRLAFKQAPFFTLSIFILGLIQALGNGLIVIQTEKLFDLVSKAIEESDYIEIALFSLIVLFLIMIVLHLINGIQNYLYDIYIKSLKNKFSFLMSEKSNKIDAISYENSAFLDLSNTARIGMENSIELVLVFGDIFTYYLPYFLFMMVYLYQIQATFVLFIILIFVPLLIAQLVRIKIFGNLENQAANYRRQLKHFDSYISDKQYVKECRALNATGFFINKLKNILFNVNKQEFKANIRMNIIETLLELVTLLGYICILVILVLSFKKGAISLGAFAAVYASLSKVFNMMEELLRYHIGQLSENIGSIDNFVRFLNYDEVECDTEQSIIQSIELVNVSFRYPNVEKEVLKNINLKIEENETIAIVGTNGSGKTTLSKIIMGLYTPSEGDILLNNSKCTNKINYNKSCLFQKFQKYKLNLDTNIKISDLDNSDEIDYLIDKFNLNEINRDIFLSPDLGGVDLSIGQWQRLSMARAFFRRANFLILDEPTASIDPIEENNFYDKFSELSKGMTTLIITHHLVSAKYANKIVVLENGSIIEQGNHDELMDRKGKYFEMFDAQKESYEKHYLGK